jgi:hypothetical protein
MIATLTTTGVGVIVLGVLLFSMIVSLTILSIEEHKTNREAMRCGLADQQPSSELTVVEGQ